jgi:hypothetical protein
MNMHGCMIVSLYIYSSKFVPPYIYIYVYGSYEHSCTYIGKGMGVDVMILPKLAAEEDPAELRYIKYQYIIIFAFMGKFSFLYKGTI